MLTSTPIPTLFQCGHIEYRPIQSRFLSIVGDLLEARNYVGENHVCYGCRKATKEKRC